MKEALESRLRVEALGKQHDRTHFRCGEAALDQYLLKQAMQDVERRLAAVFVLTTTGHDIAGFYTLSAHSVFAADMPPHIARNLPRFPLPVTLLGRMAVDVRWQGLGEMILMHALERAWSGSQQAASWAVVVDAKAGARDFYRRYDFVSLPSREQRMILPMKVAERLFGSGR